MVLAGGLFSPLVIYYTITPKDLVLYPIYFGLIYAFESRFRKRLEPDPLLHKLYGQGLTFKMVSSFVFCLVYMYYYRGGDTTGFYHWCNQWVSFLFSNPSVALEYIFTDSYQSFYTFISSSKFGGYLYLMKYGSNEDFFIRISSIINIVGLNSFMCTSLIFGYLSFLGSWKLFLVFYDMYPHLRKQLMQAIFFFPSVVFWGSGLMKDTLTLMTLFWMTHSLYFGLVKRQNVVQNVLIGVIMAYITAKLKGYIVLAFIPAAGYWAINLYRDKIKNATLRFITGPFFLVIAIVLVMGLLRFVGDSLGKYSIDKLEQTAQGYQSWHSETGGAAYTIYGAGDFSALGLLKIFPQGINVTLFRPYPWEARSIFNLLAAFESLFLFVFTLNILWRTKVFRLPEALAKDNTIIFCLTFALILGFAVGITSFNFGALVRYKIPVLPFYIIALLLIDDVIKRNPLFGKKQSG